MSLLGPHFLSEYFQVCVYYYVHTYRFSCIQKAKECPYQVKAGKSYQTSLL